MGLIKKIINWLIELFKKIFGINTKETKIAQRKVKKEKKLSKKENNLDTFFDGTMPDFMMISDINKEKLLYSISIMKNVLTDNNNLVINRLEKEIVDYIIKNGQKVDIVNIENSKELMNYDMVKSLIKDMDSKNKDIVINKYRLLVKHNDEFKIHMDSIDKICQLISENKISVVVEDAIDKEVNSIIADKDLSDNLNDRIDEFDKTVSFILETIDNNILNDVVREYQKVNYITLANIIIDKKYEDFKALENDFKNHRYNKFYYEREINRIKKELNKIKKLKNRKDVGEQIVKLRKELYTKSKDKYDLLYNNEVFMSFEKEFDNLLNKVNAKVIDIKKESKEIQEVDEKELRKQKYLENILLRFEDMKLARKLILMAQEDEDMTNIPLYVNKLYNSFNNDIIEQFNFEKNKQKTDFVILYNGLNRVICEVKKEPYLPIDHINFRMNDLVEAVQYKKEEVENMMNDRSIKVDSEKIDEKIDNLLNNNHCKEKKHVLKKEIKPKELIK